VNRNSVEQSNLVSSRSNWEWTLNARTLGKPFKGKRQSASNGKATKYGYANLTDMPILYWNCIQFLQMLTWSTDLLQNADKVQIEIRN